MVRPFKLQSITTVRFISLFKPKNEVHSRIVQCGNAQLRGKSFAAAAASAESAAPSEPPPRRTGKRIPKIQRKAMMEAYVNEYRAINGGKFPSISEAKKQVGGSHYVLREILQELEYKSKMSPPGSTTEDSGHKVQVKDDELSTNSVDHKSIRVTLDAETQTVHIQSTALNDARTDDACSKTVEAIKRSESFPSPEETLSGEVVETVIPKDCKEGEASSDHSATDEIKGHLHKENNQEEHNMKEKSRHEVLQESYNAQVQEVNERSYSFLGRHEDEKEVKAQGNHFDGHTIQDQLQNEETDKDGTSKQSTASEALHETRIQQFRTEDSPGSHELEKRKIDVPERQSSDNDSPKKSSFWGNLKSFADGILNIWKKL